MPLLASISDPIRSGGGWGEEAEVEWPAMAADELAVAAELADVEGPVLVENICNDTSRPNVEEKAQWSSHNGILFLRLVDWWAK